MNTKDVKEIKIINNGTKKVLNRNELLWGKEVWYPIRGLRFIKGNSFVFIPVSEINKYTQFKSIKLKISLESVKKFGKPTLSLSGKNLKGQELFGNVRSDDDTTYTVTFSSRIKGVIFGMFEFDLDKIGPPTENVDRVINLQSSIIE